MTLIPHITLQTIANINNTSKTKLLTNNYKQGIKISHELISQLNSCDTFYFSIAFINKSGLAVIKQALIDLKDKGIRGKIITSTYLGFNHPNVFKELLMFDNIEVRIFENEQIGFHPKGYIFKHNNNFDIIVGSSNLTQSALSTNQEWNIKIKANICDDIVTEIIGEFNMQWQHSIPLTKSWISEYEKIYVPKIAIPTIKHQNIQPNLMQQEALASLKALRNDCKDKALLISATGTGKTYLSAFDVKNVDPKRMLFVVHRENIACDAMNTFKNLIMNHTFGIFTGNNKDIDSDYIFSTIQTIHKQKYRETFKPDTFDYIIIDEVHRAGANSYQELINYFKPKFLLGMSATPERTDNFDIYKMFDYNIAYEIRLQQAMEYDLLCPFHYYGIYDETDYSGLRPVRGRYTEGDLNSVYIENAKRYNLIYKYYMKYRSKRAFGFCGSKLHAEAMAREFSRRGISAVAVYSNANGEFSENRETALERLRDGEIRVIFSIDMFNEGVDLPEVDMVLFLRPTESPIVFLQQLGRGLRKNRGKEYLNVLDFIGNYEKEGKIPQFLGGEAYRAGDSRAQEIEYPDDCIVDFEMRLIDLFRELDRKKQTIHELINREYFRVKDLLGGRVPTRMELFSRMEDDIYQMCMRNAKENPFRRYMDFLHELGELSADEETVYNGLGREFLNLLETTDMQKVYKMPVLYSFYHDGDIRMAVTEEEVLQAWKKFFSAGTNWRDLQEGITYEQYLGITDKQHLSKAKSMPVRYMKASGKGFFTDAEGYVIALKEELKPIIGSIVIKEQMKDIIEYRTMEYYRRRYQNGE